MSNRYFPEITIAEVTDSSSKIPFGKALGPDGVPDMVIMEIEARKPGILCEIFNSCFKY